jgi:hypothetical protein
VEQLRLSGDYYVNWSGAELRTLGQALSGPGLSSLELRDGKATPSLWAALPQVVCHLPSLATLTFKKASETV